MISPPQKTLFHANRRPAVVPGDNRDTQVEKYKKSDFGRCPRVLCEAQPLLPMGQNDLPGMKSVKLYCAKCEDIYNPKSSRHQAIDGAYFGTSFHNILFQVYPALLPPKSRRRYEPKVFGFRVHAYAALARWQDGQRDRLKRRLREASVHDADGAKYFEEDGSSDAEVEDENDLLEEHEAVDDAHHPHPHDVVGGGGGGGAGPAPPAPGQTVAGEGGGARLV